MGIQLPPLPNSRPLATWWESESAAQNYVRCQLPARYLPGKVEHFGVNSLKLSALGGAYFPDQEGVGIWSIPGSRTQGRAIEGMQGLGIAVLIEVDDNYLRPNWATEHEKTWAVNWQKGQHDIPNLEAHRKICVNSDGIIVTTEALYQEYNKLHREVPVYICNNAVDPSDWPEDPFQLKREEIHVGIATSSSHYWDLPLVSGALWHAAERAKVVIMGEQHPLWTFGRTTIPWHNDVADYRLDLLRLDIGLAPVGPDTAWGRFRSDLKILEYAMAGAAVVASYAEPYRHWRDSPVLMAESDVDFTKHVSYLLDHPDEIRDRARELRTIVMEERAIQETIDEWRDAIERTTHSQRAPTPA